MAPNIQVTFFAASKEAPHSASETGSIVSPDRISACELSRLCMETVNNSPLPSHFARTDNRQVPSKCQYHCAHRFSFRLRITVLCEINCCKQAWVLKKSRRLAG